jgi:1,4-alpha-glucan branching enzyme
MREIAGLAIFWLCALCTLGQVVTTSPTFPVANQPVTITVDVSGTSLANFTAYDATTNPVFIWTWIPPRAGVPTIDAPSNINPASSNTAATNPAKCSRVSTNVYQITFTPTVFFNRTAAEMPQIGLKLKTNNWNDNKQTDVDKFITFTSGFAVQFAQPIQNSFLTNTGTPISITANASQAASLTLKVNGVTVSTVPSGTSLSYTHTVAETLGSIPVVFEANNGTETKTTSFTYTIRSATVLAPIPAGIKNGINYFPDATKATLRLWAPGKSSVYVLGDFNDWTIQSAYQMKKSGEFFWLDITGLTSGTEYAFQYLVDETVYIADPYADKILDPEDSFIPAATFPNLKPFPAKALTDKWYFNRVSVIQTGQTPYTWQVTNFQKPAKEKLVIYELHIRDFFDTGKKNYQTLIDTLSYFKRLGVNAIELMPITEFNGNDSWGYNPTFMFAPDKFYGTKNKLKEFIDKCHQNGIAVILDIVMNQQDLPNAYLMQDFNFNTMKPNPTNRWFNVDATHPFNVFFDMNHESSYTKAYLDTINHYWINEYKVDGYRYDLSKGFTQVNSGTNVGAWSARDASRIAILKRMYDKIRTYSNDAYVILEHFADNAEETELSGLGMMLWGNFNGAYSQSTMGFSSNSDIGGMWYKNRGWTSPNSIGYMESHDEERLMFKNLQSGNSNTIYNVRSLPTALERMKAASTVFYTVPGPKMLWQFGELGYDISIDQGGRTSAKPIRWNYYSEPDRKALFDFTSELIKLKNTYPIFNTTDATVTQGSVFVKEVKLKGVPFKTNPTKTDEMNVHAIANFDTNAQQVAINFLHTGKWFDYKRGTEFNVTSNPYSMRMEAGEYYLFTDVPLKTVTAVGEDNKLITLFPNPATSQIRVAGETVHRITVFTSQGVEVKPVPVDATTWEVSHLAPGMYIVEVKTDNQLIRKKIIKQ